MGHPAVAEPGIRRSRAATRPGRRTLTRLAPYLLLAVYFALALTQAISASITFDEGPHLAAGYTILRTGDFRLQPVHIHPPLANVIAALPLLFQIDLPNPAAVSGWEIGSLSAITDAVVWQYPFPQRIAVVSRVPILLLGVVLGALIFRWGRDHTGCAAGTIALALFTFDPNMLAHGALVTTDMAATTLIVATLYALYRIAGTRTPRKQGRVPLIMLGLLLGLSQLTKVSALMLVPVVGALLLLGAVTSSETRAQARTRSRAISHALAPTLGRLALVLAACALTVWAGYAFSISRPQGWSLPLPAGVHLSIYQSLQEHYTLGHPTFALGRVSSTGWWWYFPLAFVLKTPLPVLILGLVLGVRAMLLAFKRAAAWSLLIGGRFALRGTWIRSVIHFGEGSGPFILLFPLGYGAAAFFSTVNIGYRHLLPVLPFLYIGLGTGIARLSPFLSGKRRAVGWVLALLGVWLVAGTLRTLPYPLAYFNELAGGPEGGYRYLVDSNLDWGQNLWDLKTWLEGHDRSTVAYAHYSPARPGSYGIEATYLPPDPRAGDFAPWNPQPGLYAIGATVLQGPYAPDLNTYAWFREREPVVTLGHALFVYEVLPQLAPNWVALCLDGMDPARLPALLGQNELRVLQLNCEEATLYPAGQAPGLYVLPPHAPPPHGAELWLVLRDSDGAPTARVFRVSPPGPEPSVPANLSPEGPLTFLGYAPAHTVVRPGQSLDLMTYWQVHAIPARPLSLMAHLVAEDGTAVAVGDGLGFPIEQWREGDVIVQRHRWMLPESLGPDTQLVIQVGAYWLDTIERWPVEDGSDRVVLQRLRVEVP